MCGATTAVRRCVGGGAWAEARGRRRGALACRLRGAVVRGAVTRLPVSARREEVDAYRHATYLMPLRAYSALCALPPVVGRELAGAATRACGRERRGLQRKLLGAQNQLEFPKFESDQKAYKWGSFRVERVYSGFDRKGAYFDLLAHTLVCIVIRKTDDTTVFDEARLVRLRRAYRHLTSAHQGTQCL